MKTNYFAKIENKYVFNLSLIFWHLFIALSTIAIGISILVFIWCIIPPFQSKIEKPTYPAKELYPEPVKVLFSDLNLEETRQDDTLQIHEPVKTSPIETKSLVHEDSNGKLEYDSLLNTLKTLIPPSNYSWSGSGYWSYPYGERYWKAYNQEKYRQWNATESGLEDKLTSSYKVSNANKYPDKSQILGSYIDVVKLLPEENRLKSIEYLIDNISGNVIQNVNSFQSIAKVASKMSNEENVQYIYKLAKFGKVNSNDGSLFISMVSTIIDKFDAEERLNIIDGLINSYYNYFNQNLAKQKEATDLFTPLLLQIKGEYQSKALMQYYGLYLNKNRDRDIEIEEIDNRYQQLIGEIDDKYNSAQAKAIMEYEGKKIAKQTFRLKSLMGIGVGILLIVLIATILTFLSIQRSVSKIEEILTTKTI